MENQCKNIFSEQSIDSIKAVDKGKDEKNKTKKEQDKFRVVETDNETVPGCVVGAAYQESNERTRKEYSKGRHKKYATNEDSAKLETKHSDRNRDKIKNECNPEEKSTESRNDPIKYKTKLENNQSETKDTKRPSESESSSTSRKYATRTRNRKQGLSQHSSGMTGANRLGNNKQTASTDSPVKSLQKKDESKRASGNITSYERKKQNQKSQKPFINTNDKSKNKGNRPKTNESSIETKVECYLERFKGTIENYMSSIKSILGSNLEYDLDSIEYGKQNIVCALIVFPSKNKAYSFCKKIAQSVTDVRIKVAICDSSVKSFPISFNHIEQKKFDAMADHQKIISELQNKIKLHEGSRKGVSDEDLQRREKRIEAWKEKLYTLKDQTSEFTKAFEKQKNILLNTDIIKMDQVYTLCKAVIDLECQRFKNALPIYTYRTQILDQINRSQTCVLIGETGSGKSTQLPLYMYESDLVGQGITVCTQPRKIAAISLAKHVSNELNMTLGKEIGYWVGRDKQSCKATKLLYTTDHILLNDCVKDPLLTRYSCVIIDEAHERSIYTDLLLGMVKHAASNRSDLKVIITSATIDPSIFVTYLGGQDNCPLVKVPGRLFPVETIYSKESCLEDENYIKTAVQKVCEIHQKNEIGNILVFLATPAETELATKLIEQKAIGKQKLKAMQLHGKQLAADQQAVFDPVPKGTRKVIFSTNIAETSVTIPDISIVIDTGLAKEKKYDAKKNMSVLEISTISQSAAKQRRGRAGRTGPGKCYCLYKEDDFHQMQKSTLPEIKNVNLGQSMLKLLELGVEDPLKFEYVESPGQENLKIAMDGLREIGAIDKETRKLTHLGQQLAKLSLEPRFGKAVIRGIEKGIGRDMALVVAYASTGTSVFYRGTSEADNRTSDGSKLNFVNEAGDFATFLHVYQQWNSKSDKEKRNWCLENFINGKTLKVIKELADEIIHIVRKELSLHCEDTALEKKENLPELVTKIMASCFPNNISLYSGHPESGYIIISGNMCVNIHPSSALRSLASNPEWILFTQLLKTSQDFALKVNPLSWELVSEMIKNQELPFTETEAIERVLQENHLGYYSSFILHQLTGPRHQIQKEIEAEISSNCCNHPCKLDINFKTGSLKLFIPFPYAQYGMQFVLKKVEQMKTEMENEIIVFDQKRTCPLVLANGGIVKHVLGDEEFLSFKVESENTNEQIVNFITDMRSLTAFKKEKCDNNKLHISMSFNNPEVAAATLNIMREKLKSVQYWLDKVNRYDSEIHNFQLKLTWIRRPLKGFAIYKLRDPAMTLLSYHLLKHQWNTSGMPLTGLSSVIRSSQNCPILYLQDGCRELTDLFVTGIDTNMYKSTSVIQQELRCFIQENCNIAAIDDIIVPRQPPHKTGDEVLERYTKKIRQVIDPIFLQNPFQLVPPDYIYDHDIFLTYLLNVCSAEDQEKALRHICSIELNYTYSNVLVQIPGHIHIPKPVMNVLNYEVNLVLDEIEGSFGDRTEIKRKKTRGGHSQIKLLCSSIEDLLQIKSMVNNIIKPEEIECLDPSGIHYHLFEPDSIKILQDIAKLTNTYISTNKVTRKIKLYGSQLNKDEFFERIKVLLAKLKDTKYENISLKEPGVVREFTRNFGVDAAELRKQHNLISVHLDLKRHSLEARGNKDALVRFKEAIDILKLNVSPQIPNTDENQDCSVCLCPIEHHLQRLEACGHAYCFECLRNQIHCSIQNQDIPIQCANEECNSLIVLKDLKLVLKDQTQLQALVKSATSCYLQQNPDKVKHCTSPDCEGIIKLNSKSPVFRCRMCHLESCTMCGLESHEGLTCYQNQNYSEEERKNELIMRKWILENPEMRGRCPSCSMAIEKIGGCCHVMCRNCKIHICWKCERLFETSRKCYDHLSKECGGIGLM